MDLPAYRERLLPRWWAWLLAGALVAMLAVAYGAALGPTVGVVVAIAAGLVAAWLLWISAPVVTVGATTLSAGGAVLPLSCVCGVEVVEPGSVFCWTLQPCSDQACQHVLRGLDATAFLHDQRLGRSSFVAQVERENS